MAKLLIKGEKVVIGKLNEGLNHLSLDLTYSNPYDPSFDIDIFVFMMDEKNRVNKNHIIFYNNPMSICKTIQYHEDYKDTENKKVFEVNLNKLPGNIEKLAFGCSIYKGINISETKNINLSFQVRDKMTNMKMFEIHDGMDVTRKEAMILGDIYQYKDMWKFNTVIHQHEENLLNLMKKLYNTTIY